MTDREVKEQADILRNESKAILGGLFHIPEGCESTGINRFVDCVISSAMLEIAMLNKEASKHYTKERNP